nr:lysylphosphatidylglycerol synthase transmembrane domain-containing protein [Halovenus carboxidivorans]
MVSTVQYGVGLVALGWLLTQVQFGRVAALLGDLDALTVALVLAVSVIGLCGRFYTWHVVLNRLQPVSFRAAASTDLMVNFINQLLPSRLSGRVAAPFVLRSRTGLSYPDAVAASGVHTGIYAVVYGLVATAGLLATATALSTEILLVVALSTGLYLAAGAVVLLAGVNLTLLDRLIAALEGPLSRLPRIGETVVERIDDAVDFTAASTAAFRGLAGSPAVWLGYAAGWALALALAPAARVWLLLEAFGVPFRPAVLLPLVLVMAYSVTLLPLTPGGIGVTEATATLVFVALGVPNAVIVPVIFVDRFLGVYLPALGGWYPSLQLDLSELSTDADAGE